MNLSKITLDNIVNFFMLILHVIEINVNEWKWKVYTNLNEIGIFLCDILHNYTQLLMTSVI